MVVWKKRLTISAGMNCRLRLSAEIFGCVGGGTSFVRSNS